MKCPVCYSITPSAPLRCAHCGTPFHSTGVEEERQAPLTAVAEPLVRLRRVRIAALAVMLLAAGASGYAPAHQHTQTPGSHPSIAPAEADSAQPGTTDEQAQAVDDVLAAAADLIPVWEVAADSCDSAVGAMADLQASVQTRQSQLEQTRGLRVDQLTGGPELRQAMLNAYQYSLNASQAYLTWSHEAEAENCGEGMPSETGNLDQARISDVQADEAKEQVSSLWDPIASSQGLTPYMQEEI